MPYLRITVDETIVVAIPTDGSTIVGARISGSRDEASVGELSAWGGVYGCEDLDVHRIWLEEAELRAGQVVEIEFRTAGPQVGEGRVFEATAAAGPPVGHSFEGDIRAMAREMRATKWLKAPYEFHYVSSQATAVTFKTTPDEYGFGFNVLWNDLRPDRVSVSLYAYTIESFERQESGRTLHSERLLVDQKCKLALVA